MEGIEKPEFIIISQNEHSGYSIMKIILVWKF